ncbi:hypothetical protein KX935_04050 [Streptobacillus moniliformis]|nr:hypothetical protein KX935_04050 [Streptobacillus moniliformis]
MISSSNNLNFLNEKEEKLERLENKIEKLNKKIRIILKKIDFRRSFKNV